MGLVRLLRSVTAARRPLATPPARRFSVGPPTARPRQCRTSSRPSPPSTPADAARLHGLTVADLESWIEKFMEGGREGLRAVPRELEAKFEAERTDPLAKVGEVTLRADVLKTTSRSASGLMGASGQAASVELPSSPPWPPRASGRRSPRSARSWVSRDPPPAPCRANA